MIVSIVTLTTVLLAGSAFADDDSIRARLMGRWQSEGNQEAKSTWALNGSGDSIHVTISNGTQTVADFECNTLGKECDVKDAGRKSKVSMYFNGLRLVELETKRTQVVKRRFIIAADGDTMDVETIPIAPPGKSETTHFKRIPSTAAKQ